MQQEGGEEKRLALIENFKELKLKQDLVIATKFITTFGPEVMEIFCQDCSEELKQGIDGVILAAGIVGNALSGNFAGAALQLFGIFKEPQPSPEFQLLQQVSRQLRSLEANMNRQFKAVHEHLFALEQNLGTRMRIVDFRVEQLTQFVLAAHIQTMEQLSGIDDKLNYVINQNECTKDLILTLTRQGGQDLCKAPVLEFKNRVFNAQIADFQALDNFFRGNVCQPCIKALFDASSVTLVDNASFRYAQCNVAGVDNKARPDKAYEFIFQQFIRPRAADSVFVNSLLLLPRDVNIAASFPDSVRLFLQRSVLDLHEEDRHFRNHRAIMAYADYVLTMFTMMEFLDEQRLLTPAEISANPGFSRERARRMILVLEGLRDLLNHAMAQQTIMAGNGMFATLDQLIRLGSEASGSDAANFNLADIFYYNPYVSKNYAAYLIDRHIGLDRLKDMVGNKRLKKGKQRIALEGFNILFYEDQNDQPEFVISLTNQAEPDKNIPILRGALPVIDHTLDEEAYQRNLEFIFPLAYAELHGMRENVIAKLVEMNLVVSPTLDTNNGALTRQDLQLLISSSKN